MTGYVGLGVVSDSGGKLKVALDGRQPAVQTEQHLEIVAGERFVGHGCHVSGLTALPISSGAITRHAQRC